MYLEVKRTFGNRCGKQRKGFALYMVSVDAGRRRRKHIRSGSPSHSAFLDEFRNRAPLPSGRPPTYPEQIKAIFTACGLNVNGARLSMAKNRYFLSSSAEARFEMLSDEDKISVGSAENLLSAEKQAYALLKRANVKRIPRRYSDCLREAMFKAASLKPPTASSADVPPVPV